MFTHIDIQLQPIDFCYAETSCPKIVGQLQEFRIFEE